MKSRLIAAVCGLLASGAGAAPIESAKTIEQKAHGGYLAATNSINVDTLTAAATGDVVYQSPNEPEVVGRAAVRKWAIDTWSSSLPAGKQGAVLRSALPVVL